MSENKTDLRIPPEDTPKAIITPATHLSAGRGWPRLMRGVLPRGDREISAVDGLLYVEIAGRYTSLTRSDIEWAWSESGKICGEPGCECVATTIFFVLSSKYDK